MTIKDYKVGIAGCGIVGGSMLKFFNEKQINVVGYDKYKSEMDDFNAVLDTDAIFLCLPTQYNEINKNYDYTAIHDVMSNLKANDYQGLVVFKSTVTPGITVELHEKYGLDICYYPEFLSALTAYEDFVEQPHIILGVINHVKENQLSEKYLNLIEFFKLYFPKSKLSIASTTEAESAKLFCNNFYSVKIGIFNEFYDVCKKNNVDYNNVVSLMLNNNWINPMHTMVPGPDKSFGFGGLCFIKDTNSLNDYMIRNNISNSILNSTIDENKSRRNLNDENINCIAKETNMMDNIVKYFNY